MSGEAKQLHCSCKLSINQAMRDYKRLGYSDNWINQRLKSIEFRKELTDD